MEQRRELVEDRLPDVDVDGPGVVQAEQVLRQAAGQKVGPRPIRERPARMALGRLEIAEGLEVNLGGAPAEQRARLPEHLPLREPEIRTAQEQHHVAGVPPAPVPALLKAREKSGARGRDPLKLVEGEAELRPGVGGGPLLDHGFVKSCFDKSRLDKLRGMGSATRACFAHSRPSPMERGRFPVPSAERRRRPVPPFRADGARVHYPRIQSSVLRPSIRS